uniref:Pleckstrin homology domain containing, family O member 1a n=1 Tax=Seriola dumerili TaxID=41447 RepID=A0A3B4T7A7_SERDU
IKKQHSQHLGVQDSGQPAVQQPEKVGWIRKFCGRGIFRELWRNRYVVLRGDHLFISDKEVKDERKAQEVFDLADYERSEELRKAKSRSKKNHSRFTVLRCRQPGNTVPNLVFLAVSPEEKESWVNALNAAIIKAKNRVLDEVTIEEDSALVHPTRDRAKIPHGRRLPTRGHLMAVASTSSHGTLTLDLVAEEDGFSLDYDDDSQESWENSFRVDLQRGDFCGQVAVVGSRGVGGRQRAGTDVSKLRVVSKEPKVKTGSLPRGSERSWGKQSHLEVHKTQQKKINLEPDGTFGLTASPMSLIDSFIDLLYHRKLQELQKAKAERERGGSSPYLKGIDSPRLHHLRGSDSPHSRSKNRSKGTDSPRSRGSHSPAAKANDSPRPKESPRFTAPDSPRSKSSDKVCSPSLKGSSSSSALPASPPSLLSEEDLDVERRRAEAERLLEEAVSSWKEAQEVLQEVKELQSQTLRRQRRRTYEKMTSTTAVAAAADEDDTPASPTSPEEDDESETP